MTLEKMRPLLSGKDSLGNVGNSFPDLVKKAKELDSKKNLKSQHELKD